jgi:hypothetical protein
MQFRDSIFGMKGGPQRIVPGHQQIKSYLQCFSIQCAFKDKLKGNVVRAAALRGLLNKPKPFLGRR